MPIVLPELLLEGGSGSVEEERAEIDSHPRFPDDTYADRLAEDWWREWSEEADILSRPRPVVGAPIEPPGPAVGCSGACEWLFENTFINANGDVGTCSLMPTNSLGNILQVESFSDIWNGEDMVALRERYWKGAVPHHCYGCHVLMHGYLKRVSLLEPVDPENFRSTRFQSPSGGSGVSLKNP